MSGISKLATDGIDAHEAAAIADASAARERAKAEAVIGPQLDAAQTTAANAMQTANAAKTDAAKPTPRLDALEAWRGTMPGTLTDIANQAVQATTVATAAQSAADTHAARRDNPHQVTKSDVGLSQVTNAAQVRRDEMGVANGVATLGADGKVPSGQLPAVAAAPVTSVNGQTGAVVVNVPTVPVVATASANGLMSATDKTKLDSLAAPLRTTVNQSLPLIALGGLHSFTVTVTGATTAHSAKVTPPTGLLGSLAMYDASVTAANTVTVTLKAGLAISAGSQTFKIVVW